MAEQDRGTPYESALEKRHSALKAYGIARQKLASAQLDLEEAETELQLADRELARVLRLPGRHGVNLQDLLTD